MVEQTVFKLKYAIKNYDWGVKGKASYVARLKAADDSGFSVNEQTSYSELWMGSHPNGEAQIEINTKWVPITEYLGGKPLSYLFKVLSVRESLSIQVHPDKEMAEKLFAKNPKMYADANHKPEMAIALTEFRALLGIRNIDEIKKFVYCCRPLQSLIGPEWLEKCNSNIDPAILIKECIVKLLECDSTKLKTAIDDILIKQEKFDDDGQELMSLFLHLHESHPYDVGCFLILIMNVVKLNPGQAIYLGANQPHAYLLGDCMECMANSDNVVRLGLTNKLKDIETMVSITNFSPRSLKEFLVEPKRYVGVEEKASFQRMEYSPPVEEFKVTQIAIQKLDSKSEINDICALSILIVLKSSCDFTFVSKSEESFLAKAGNCYFFSEGGKLWGNNVGPTGFVAYLAQPNKL